MLNDWCNKGCGMCYSVCGMVHIIEILLLIGKSQICVTVSLCKRMCITDNSCLTSTFDKHQKAIFCKMFSSWQKKKKKKRYFGFFLVFKWCVCVCVCVCACVHTARYVWNKKTSVFPQCSAGYDVFNQNKYTTTITVDMSVCSTSNISTIINTLDTQILLFLYASLSIYFWLY